MSIGYIKRADGSQDIITNEILDAGQVVQTLDDNILKGDVTEVRIFFTEGIPMVPVATSMLLYEAVVSLRHFEVIDNRIYDA
jgi:hypothetical protein